MGITKTTRLIEKHRKCLEILEEIKELELMREKTYNRLEKLSDNSKVLNKVLKDRLKSINRLMLNLTNKYLHENSH